jgi:hypothetical protein
MFLCTECHEKSGCTLEHFSRSQGPCEYCHKEALCSDCHDYDFRKPKLESKVGPIKNWKRHNADNGEHIWEGNRYLATVAQERSPGGLGWGTNANRVAKRAIACQELYNSLVEADRVICELCKRVNPQHRDCNSCQERDKRLALLNEVKEI